MIYWFKRKYRQVKRVLDYLPIIWKGYDWDYKYAIDLFAHQLGRMADHFESSRACTLSAGDNAKRIRTTLKLMKLVGDEEYAMEYFDYEDVEYNFVPLKDDEGYSTIETDYKSETYDDFFKKYPLIHKRVLNGEGIWGKQDNANNVTDFELKRNVAKNIAYLNQERARKTLHKLIERNIQSWWD
tara:strand:+ start:294 stop:845 length:552 start_codon:yes stop_codon:yes gene_type:complete